MHRHIKMLGLELVFATILSALAYAKWDTLEMPSVLEFIILGLACMRAAQTISFNEIGEPLRSPFCVVEKDSCGAGDNVHPKNDSVLGSLLACPICSGTWAALVLVSLWVLIKPLAIVLVLVLGVAGLSEVLHYLTELLSWSARLARVLSGAVSPDKE